MSQNLTNSRDSGNLLVRPEKNYKLACRGASLLTVTVLAVLQFFRIKSLPNENNWDKHSW